MICYKDTTFCPYYKKCAKQLECSRPLTDKVKKDAASVGLPISQWIEEPYCMEKLK